MSYALHKVKGVTKKGAKIDMDIGNSTLVSPISAFVKNFL